MAEAKAKDSWTHTSCVMALIANVNRDPKKSKVFKPADFNPFDLDKPKLKTKDLSILKSTFVKDGKDK